MSAGTSQTAVAMKMNVAGISATASLGDMFNSRNGLPPTPSPPIENFSGFDQDSEDGYTASCSGTGSSANETQYERECHVTPEYVPGCFEGPEKTMEVVFKTGVGAEEGLRALTREQLDYLCTQAKCTILSKISSNYIDAYVLSESSLFIYKHKYIMKTCGTTTLLRCLSSLLQFADALGMKLTWVGYSRKNLLYPR